MNVEVSLEPSYYVMLAYGVGCMVIAGFVGFQLFQERQLQREMKKLEDRV